MDSSAEKTFDNEEEEEEEEIIVNHDNIKDDITKNLTYFNLTQADLNRIRIFFASRLNQPMVCVSSVNLFSTTNMDILSLPITYDTWDFVLQGALVLVVNYDEELPDEICGAKLMIVNHETSDTLWSQKLYSWNNYQVIDNNTHIFLESNFNDSKKAFGLYFDNIKASSQFYGYVRDYLERVVIYERRDLSARKDAIKQYKNNLKNQRKQDPVSKSAISAPVMFCHTLHIKK